MKSETLLHQHPPTPPNIGHDLHAGLHQIAQYNVSRNYSFDGSLPHGSAYGSPEPGVHDVVHHSLPLRAHESHPGSEIDLGAHYVSSNVTELKFRMLISLQDGYGQGSTYYSEGHMNGGQVSDHAIRSL